MNFDLISKNQNSITPATSTKQFTPNCLLVAKTKMKIAQRQRQRGAYLGEKSFGAHAVSIILGALNSWLIKHLATSALHMALLNFECNVL